MVTQTLLFRMGFYLSVVLNPTLGLSKSGYAVLTESCLKWRGLPATQ